MMASVHRVLAGLSRVWRVTAASWLVLSILVVTAVMIVHVNTTLSEIERALPLAILAQRQDVARLEQRISDLYHAVSENRANPAGVRSILGSVNDLGAELDRIRHTYKLDNLIGAAALYAVIHPMLYDVHKWLTEGVHGYQLSDAQLLALVRTRVENAYFQAIGLVEASDQRAVAILNEQSRKIASFRKQMTVVFATLFLAMLALVYYIFRRNAAQRALNAERRRAQVALDAADLYDWDWHAPSEHLRWGRNPAGLLGPPDERGEYPLFSTLVHEDHRQAFLSTTQAALRQGDPYRIEFRFRRTDGVIRWFESQGRRVLDGHGGPNRLIGAIQDITERKQVEERIHHYAYFDTLTGLPNRQQLVGRLEAAVNRAVGLELKGALLFMDLDNFKNINDSLGHHIGDRLLKRIADRIGEVVRSTDLVGRLGGDEFTVLLPELSPSLEEARKITRRISEKIQHQLAQPYRIDGHELQISVSIGVSVFPLTDCALEDMAAELLKNADAAMYRAKAAGRNTIKFFAASMQEAADRKLAVQQTIQQALKRDHIRFDFQPQVDVDGRIVGVEALLRLDSPEVTELDTEDIIEVAEESGLMLPLGDWVIVHACRHLRRWQRDGVNVGRLAINVSPRQFHQDDFVDRVARVLSETQANPACLEMEITEGAVMMNVESAIVKMNALRALGISLAIDDFGTGYSSLAYLKRLPLDRIKIDQSFTREVVWNPSDAVIVETIIAMAQVLGLEVIAEGVETGVALETLTRCSCTVFQGHYLSFPVDEPSLLQLLRHGLPQEAVHPTVRDSGRRAG